MIAVAPSEKFDLRKEARKTPPLGEISDFSFLLLSLPPSGRKDPSLSEQITSRQALEGLAFFSLLHPKLCKVEYNRKSTVNETGQTDFTPHTNSPASPIRMSQMDYPSTNN